MDNKEKNKKQLDLYHDLISLYPNKKIFNLSKQINVYAKVKYYAKRKRITIKKYIEDMGFVYSDSIKTSEEVENDYFNELINLYPDKKVINLYNDHFKLYAKIERFARRKKMSMRKYLKSIGFELMSREHKSFEDVLFELNNQFPDKIIKDFSNNRKLYEYVNCKSKSAKISIREYLKRHGFQYTRNEILDEESIKKELKKLYPDNKVVYLGRKNKELLNKISSKAKIKNISIHNYLKNLGFEYRSRSLKSDRVKNIVDLLNDLFPDKNIFSSKAIGDDLYLRIRYEAKLESISIGQFLNKYGFNYLKKINS